MISSRNQYVENVITDRGSCLACLTLFDVLFSAEEMAVMREQDSPSMGPDDWLAHVKPSRRVEITVAAVLLVLLVVILATTCFFIRRDLCRWRSARMKITQVHPVTGAVFDAADPAPAPAQATIQVWVLIIVLPFWIYSVLAHMPVRCTRREKTLS